MREDRIHLFFRLLAKNCHNTLHLNQYLFVKNNRSQLKLAQIKRNLLEAYGHVMGLICRKNS